MTTSNTVPVIERFGVTIGTLVLIVAQTVAVVGWLSSDHAQILRLNEKAGELLEHINAVDSNGTRYEAQFIARVTQLEAASIANNRHFELLEKRIEDEHAAAVTETLAENKLQAQIDLLKQEDTRLWEQQMRIIQALDNTYNLLQEHLRVTGSKEINPRLELPRPTPPQ